ncbi:UGSC family (seleno)protein [Thermodesulfobacteriota bacterium]
MRASITAENAGVPSASLVTEGFIKQGQSTANGSGMPYLPLAEIPGHTDMFSDETFEKIITDVTLDQVIDALIAQPKEVVKTSEPNPGDVIFSGGFEDVNRFFYQNNWQEGIPIIPPTREKVDQFLKFTYRSADEVIGVLLPDKREATVLNTAINGVMAGCRPEYMPVLIALVEVLSDPDYGVEHSSNTPGAEALITINGPIIKALKFNYTQGALRVGFQANTSIGRFFRLYLRNVAGFLPHETDKGTFGNTFRVVLAENEDALTKIGWKPTSFYQGFDPGENVVTISRYTSGGVIVSVYGSTAEQVLPYLCDGLVKHIGWELIFTSGTKGNPGFACTQKPHLILSPCIAEVIAKSGYSKQDVQIYLYEHARISASKFEQIHLWMHAIKVDLGELVESGIAPSVFAESADPDRMVPVVCKPEDFLITVSGDPLRNNAYALISNGCLGYTTSKKIELPNDWDDLLKEAETAR